MSVATAKIEVSLPLSLSALNNRKAKPIRCFHLHFAPDFCDNSVGTGSESGDKKMKMRDHEGRRGAGSLPEDFPIMDAEGLLGKINDPAATPYERETAILFAETTSFNETQRGRLLSELACAITATRFSRNRRRVTVFGSAARKYAMNMDESRFEAYAEWLKPSKTETLSCGVELELVKGVCYRLSYVPVRRPAHFPELTATLAEVVHGYLSPRLILQKNYASIALQGIIALAILQAVCGERDTIRTLFRKAASLGLDWFCESMEHRLREARKAIEKHDAALAQSLGELIEGEWSAAVSNAGSDTV